MGPSTPRTRRAAVPGQRTADTAFQPLADESLASWINAMARHSGVETRALLREFQLSRDGALTMAQTRLSEQSVRRLSRKTGISEAVLHGMTLARYAGNALPHLPVSPWVDGAAVRQWSSSAWLMDHEARWCARCLREDDMRWPLRWMLPWNFACLRHRVYMATECVRCLSPVRFGRHLSLDRSCDARVEDARRRYGHDGPCAYPITMHRPLPVSDEAVLGLQTRISTWLDGSATVDDRQLVSLTAVMIMLVTPVMLRRSGEDPALLCNLRSRRYVGRMAERRLWADPLRVAAAASVAQRVLSSRPSAAEVARHVADLRSLDYRDAPWRLDVMEWAYGAALRPNPYVEELVRQGVITIGSYKQA
ncbi:TniQ family protein [Streptomyces sp. NA02950]|uniref:TniQ family protein n=1 Tax=Streptomyces sp. NA02950 TaxID=2742137 RepID=UPI0015917A98|nr:TniQ family protein [Streptomyces sp. NA02950]QKV93743.1 TniQ family protein [Streptomyces sp. NA02950]